MDDFIPDASVAIAWVAEAQSSAETDALLADVNAGRAMIVPSLWKLETANTLLVLRRRRRVSTRDWQRGLEVLRKLDPAVDEEGPASALTDVIEIADADSRTIYDAVYLELAIRRKLPLATRDRALNAAARRRGVKTLL